MRKPIYNAFISYSHARDGVAAKALQSELQTFARPWYRARALRVFRDETNLAAAPGLWTEIEAALADSSWFVLLASPGAAGSVWVQREVMWWLANKGPDRLLIAWTAGTLDWDQGANDFNWQTTDCLPQLLSGTFSAEPHYIDLRRLHDAAVEGADELPRLGDQVADFAAPIRGMAKDALIGEHHRLRRRLRRTVSAVVATLTLLLAATSVATFVAVGQRDQAIRERKEAVSAGLVDAARTRVDSRPDLAALLAIESMRLSPGIGGRSAALDVVQRTNALRAVGFVETGDIRQIVPAGNSRSQVLVSGSQVLMWDPEQRALSRTPLRIAAGAIVKPVAVLADSRIAAVSGQTIQTFWPGGTGRAELTVSSTGDPVWALAAHPVKAAIAWGTRTGAVAISDPDARTHHLVRRQGAAVLRLAFSADGTVLAIADTAGVTLWNVRNRTQRTLVKTPSDTVTEMAFQPRSNRVLATLTRVDQRLRFWDVDRGTALEAPARDGRLVDDPIRDFAYSADGTRIAVTTSDGAIAVWDAVGRDERIAVSPAFGGRAPGTLSFTADGKALATGESDGLLLLRDLSIEQASPALGPGAKSSAVSEDGRVLVSAGTNGIWRWDLAQPAPVAQPVSTGHAQRDHIALSSDGTLVATAGMKDGRSLIEVRTLRTGAAVGPPLDVTRPSAAVLAIAFSEDGVLAVSSGDRVITLWDLESRKAVGRMRTPAYVNSLRPLSDGRLVSGSDPAVIVNVEPSRPLELVPWPGQSGTFSASRDGRVISAAQNDGSIVIWDVRHGRQLAQTAPTTDRPSLLALSPDGTTLASVSSRALRFWEVASGVQVGGTLALPEGGAQTMAMTSDGSRLVLQSYGKAPRFYDRALWTANRTAIAERLCRIAGRNLTADEWARFLPGDQYRVTCHEWPGGGGCLVKLLSPDDNAVLPQGADNSGNDGVDWRFEWRGCPKAERFHLRVLGPGARNASIDEQAITGTTYSIRRKGSYIIDRNRFGWSWKVRPFVDGRWGAWSEERHFDVTAR